MWMGKFPSPVKLILPAGFPTTVLSGPKKILLTCYWLSLSIPWPRLSLKMPKLMCLSGKSSYISIFNSGCARVRAPEIIEPLFVARQIFLKARALSWVCSWECAPLSSGLAQVRVLYLSGVSKCARVITRKCQNAPALSRGHVKCARFNTRMNQRARALSQCHVSRQVRAFHGEIEENWVLTLFCKGRQNFIEFPAALIFAFKLPFWI